MFRVSDDQALVKGVTEAEKNYVIRKNDLLSLSVFTNLGEQIVDPEPSAVKPEAAERPVYLVDQQGIIKFPLISPLKVEGYTLVEAERALESEYAKFFNQPFVRLSYANKRVVVLGAAGGQVIPLANENMRLTEILALCKGLNNDAKADNIRVLRGKEVMIADLTTIEGYRSSNFIMQPDDIVYIEPVRRPLSEAIRDYGPVITAITSLTTLIVVLIGIN